MPFWVDTILGLIMPAAVGEPFGGSTPAAQASPGTPPLVGPFVPGKSPTSPWAIHQIEQGAVIIQNFTHPNEQICTLGETALAEDTDAGLGRVKVISSADFPAPTFRARIDDEIITVYATVGGVWFCDRGTDGTKVVAHTATTAVTALLTADAVTRSVTASGGVRVVPAANIPATIPPGSLFIPQEGGLAQMSQGGLVGFGPFFGLKAPNLTRMSWFNRGAFANAAQAGSTIFVTSGADTSGFAARILEQPYRRGATVTVGVIPFIWNVSYQQVGLILRDSVGGKCSTWCTTYGNEIDASNQNGVNSAGSIFYSVPVMTHGGPLFFRYREDATYRYFGISYDNVYYWEDPVYLIRARNDWMSPDRVGVYHTNYNNATPFSYTIIHWDNGS